MSITLQQTISLAGKLDDSQGSDTPRERFRQFLHEKSPKSGKSETISRSV